MIFQNFKHKDFAKLILPTTLVNQRQRILELDYSKTPLLRPPLGLRKNGLYSGVVLLLR